MYSKSLPNLLITDSNKELWIKQLEGQKNIALLSKRFITSSSLSLDGFNWECRQQDGLDFESHLQDDSNLKSCYQHDEGYQSYLDRHKTLDENQLRCYGIGAYKESYPRAKENRWQHIDELSDSSQSESYRDIAL